MPEICNFSVPYGLYNVSFTNFGNESEIIFNDEYRTVPELPFVLKLIPTIFYVLIFITGVAGNILVIFVVSRNKELKTSTNFFLANLSVADLLVLFINLPSSLMEVYTKEVWYLGKFMCKFLPFLECCVVNASIQTMIAISLDRFYAICRPLKALSICTMGRALKTLIVIWIISLLIALPFFWIGDFKDSKFVDGTPIKVCRLTMNYWLPRMYAVSLTVLTFLIPLVILIGVYSIISRDLVSDSSFPEHFTSATTLRARKQVVMMLITIIFLFFTFHLPYRLLSLLLIFDKHVLSRLGFVGYYATLFSFRLFVHIHSAVNPIVYNIMSTNFREAFTSLLGCGGKQKLKLIVRRNSWGSRTGGAQRYDSLNTLRTNGASAIPLNKFPNRTSRIQVAYGSERIGNKRSRMCNIEETQPLSNIISGV